MATKKVSALTESTSPAGTEELLINDGGTSKKVTINNNEVTFRNIRKIISTKSLF